MSHVTVILNVQQSNYALIINAKRFLAQLPMIAFLHIRNVLFLWEFAKPVQLMLIVFLGSVTEGMFATYPQGLVFRLLITVFSQITVLLSQALFALIIFALLAPLTLNVQINSQILVKHIAHQEHVSNAQIIRIV